MTTDRTALLRAVLDFHGEDTPRLLYADELEVDEPARASLVRGQIELAQMDDSGVGKQGSLFAKRYRSLRRLERALLADHGAWWLGLSLPDPTLSALHRSKPIIELGNGHSWHTFSRGFVSAVSGTPGVLFGGPCNRCHGNLVIPMRDDEGERTCHHCEYTGRTPGIAAKLFACQPVERVTIVGAQPWHLSEYSSAPEQWGWLNDRDHPSGGPAVLPYELWVRTKKTYLTPNEATADLSGAAVQLGRSLAAGWTHEGPCGCDGGAIDTGGFTPWGEPISVSCGLCDGTGTVTRPGLGPLTWEGT